MRLFFALWPDRAALDALETLQAGLAMHCGGRPMRREQLHLTMAFLGEVNERAAQQLPALLADVRTRRFELCVDRVGSWFPPGIIWAGPSAIAPPLDEMKTQLDRNLQSLGFPVEQRAFRPHVTLFRNAARRAPPGVCDIRWVIDELSLVRSDPGPEGSRYEVLACTALR